MGSGCCPSGDDRVIYQIVLIVDIKYTIPIIESPYQ